MKCRFLSSCTVFHTFVAGGKSFLNATEDEEEAVQTIEFSTPKYGIKNYPANFAWQWFLIVPEGRQVQITFDAFELEQSEHCENDYLEIREAYFNDPFRRLELGAEYGAILSKPVCGSTKPRTIQSAGNMVWVQFKSDSNTTTTYKGFKASFTAGMFLDKSPKFLTDQKFSEKINLNFVASNNSYGWSLSRNRKQKNMSNFWPKTWSRSIKKFEQWLLTREFLKQ